jgi:LCP family protein required for cell wall assembly
MARSPGGSSESPNRPWHEQRRLRPHPRRVITNRRVFASLLVALALVAGACSSGGTETSTTAAPTTSSSPTTAPAITATTPPPSTTTTKPPAEVVISLDNAPEEAVEALEAFYGWLADRRRPEPDVPDGLLAHLADAPETGDLHLQGEWSAAELPERDDVGVAVFGEDVVLLVGDDAGWRIVGAKLASVGLGPWYGEPVRHVLVLGTDARHGTPQLEARADSIHILSSAIAERTGAIVGFPRDSYVERPEGYPDSPEGHFLKFTHANVWFGADAMVQIAEEVSGLDIDGYLITGFLGFEGLVDAFGGVPVDVPFRMAYPAWHLNAGLQTLWSADALTFSRDREIPDGDFRRSLDQGLVMAGALGKVQEEFGLLDLPALLAMLLEFTWTDLDAEALLTIAAGAFELDPETIPNIVLSGFPTSRGGQYVVLLDDEVADIFADLQDGMLTEELPPGTLTYDQG